MKIMDSDHCVALLRGRLDLRGRLAPGEDLAVTALSVGELVYGVYKSSHVEDNLARLGLLLVELVVLPYNEGAAGRFGCAKAELERVSEGLNDLGSTDCQHCPGIWCTAGHAQPAPFRACVRSGNRGLAEVRRSG